MLTADQIDEGFLYLGSYQVAINRRVIGSLQIDYILNITGECDMPFSSDPSIKYLRCALDDDPKCNIAAHFEESQAFITEAKARGSRVMVHCKQGMRSGIAGIL